MKNVTLSADERLIEAARERARREHTTLNAEFRRWLDDYAERQKKVQSALETLNDLRETLDTGGQTFTREEMNER